MPIKMAGTITPTMQNKDGKDYTVSVDLWIDPYDQDQESQRHGQRYKEEGCIHDIPQNQGTMPIPRIIKTSMLHLMVFLRFSCLVKPVFSRKSWVTEAAAVNI